MPKWKQHISKRGFPQLTKTARIYKSVLKSCMLKKIDCKVEGFCKVLTKDPNGTIPLSSFLHNRTAPSCPEEEDFACFFSIRFGWPGNKASLRQACSCHCRRNHNFKINTIISILNTLSYSQPTIVLRLTYNGVNLKVSYFLDPSWINKSEQYT